MNNMNNIIHNFLSKFNILCMNVPQRSQREKEHQHHTSWLTARNAPPLSVSFVLIFSIRSSQKKYPLVI